MIFFFLTRSSKLITRNWSYRDGGDKSKPPSMYSFNVLGRFGVIIQVLAQFPHADRQRDVTNRGFWPDCGKKFVFCHQTAWTRYQIVQHREGFWRQLDHFRSTPDAGILRIKPKSSKASGSLGRHASLVAVSKRNLKEI